ncbi:MAG: hypothetical protein GY708_05990 [Actinomycetia bacterium]|nr:hypothetical protein [Actinomycetes bacterium]
MDDALDLIEEALAVEGVDAPIVDGQVTFGDNVLNLDNLLRSLAGIPEDDWESEVDRFVTLFTDLGSDETSEAYELVQADLRVVVRDPDQFGGVPVVRNDLGIGLVEAVVVDSPEAVRYVTSDDLGEWELEADELFERARANTRALDVEFEEVEVFDGTYLTLVTADYFSSSFLLFPEAIIDAEAPYGYLIALPGRDIMVVHVLEDRSILTDIAGIMGQFAADTYAEAPGPLTDELFWLTGGEILPVLEVQPGMFAFPFGHELPPGE